MIDVLDIDHKEHAKEITSADFHTYGIHTKCFVTCQIPDDYYNNYLMHFIKEDDRKIQARKKTACERAFSFVNSELKATYQKKPPKESKHECDDKGNEINYYQDEDDSDSVESNAYDINPRRGLDLLLVRNEYAINMEHVRRLKEAIMYHHLFDIGFRVIHKNKRTEESYQKTCYCPLSGLSKKWCHIHNIKHGDSKFPEDHLCKNNSFTPKGLYDHFKSRGETCNYHLFLHQYMINFYSNWYKVPNQKKTIGDPHFALAGSKHSSQREVFDCIKNYIIDLNGPKNPDLKNDATKTTDKCVPCKEASIEKNLNQQDSMKSSEQSIVDSMVKNVKPVNSKNIMQSSTEIVFFSDDERNLKLPAKSIVSDKKNKVIQVIRTYQWIYLLINLSNLKK